MARRWLFYRDLPPVVVIIGNECNDMGLLTLFKAATLQGMNNHVFVAYAYAVATIVLLPLTLFSKRARVVPPLSLSIISKIVLLGAIGFGMLCRSSSQLMGYAGIDYSSPTLASSIGNLGILGKLIGNVVFSWSLRLKGPIFVTSFRPLQIVVSVAMGVMFLGDTLHVGIIIGATIISIGWGKVTEEIEEDVGSLESQATLNAPLLQSYRTESYENVERQVI